MPVSLKRIPSSGAYILLGKCEVCGADANFGFELELRRAFKALDAGDKVKAKANLGRWYCIEHFRLKKK